MTFGLYKLRKGKDIKLLEDKFQKKLKLKTQNSKLITFYNGRSAIYHALKIIGINPEDEVIVNGYTCVSVSNAVIQSGAKIIYSDIERVSLSFDYEKLLKNISKKTKVIIIQHTFGKQARDYTKIIELAKQKNILIIEDCAHSLGNKQKILGDFAIFSTGRDKVISSVTGGFLVINNPNYFDKIDKVKDELKLPSISLTLKNLNYNIVAYKTYLTYNIFKIGRLLMYISLKLKLIPLILTKSEKNCDFNKFNYKLPNSLAYLGLKELEKINKYNKHRFEIANLYLDNLADIKEIKFTGYSINRIYFGFPIILDDGYEDLYKFARIYDIILGKFWSDTNIAPEGTNIKKAGYIKGSCPLAEDISKKLLILPNHSNTTKEDALKVIDIINKFYNKNVQSKNNNR